MPNLSHDVNVRRATGADAAAVAAVLQASFVEYERLYTPAAYAATTPTEEGVLERMREGPIWVATGERGVFGTAAAVIRSDGVYIRGMAVIPGARGRRIGDRLLDAVEEFACENGQSRLYLDTTPFLESAIRLYERRGFHRTNVRRHLHDTPLFRMEKRLVSEPQQH